jgi:predicted helicase
MRPLFTVHAGEYLVGAHIEWRFKRVNVWVPVRDTGVDLLVSDEWNRQTVSLQVKFSKDFLVTHHGPEFQKALRAWI